MESSPSAANFVNAPVLMAAGATRIGNQAIMQNRKGPWPRLAACLAALAVPFVLAASKDSSAPTNGADANQLVQQLGSKQLADRAAAEQALLALGRPALHALRQGVKSDDPEIRRRSRVLIELIDADAIGLRQLGCEVDVDSNLPDEPFLRATLLSGQAAAGDLDRVARLSSLQGLTLKGQTFTDASLARLRGLKHLKNLVLVQTPTTDRAFASLATFDDLQYLCLYKTKITDEALGQLSAFKNLSTLDLRGTAVTDAGLERLAHLDKLTSLWLDDTDVTDAGLEHLNGLRGLVWLRFSGTKITDAGLTALAGLSNLRLLLLENTAISDAGLPALARLRQLCILGTDGTKVTPSGFARLARSIPYLREP
jgi:Leucine-rich repeat (LRR) protein